MKWLMQLLCRHTWIDYYFHQIDLATRSPYRTYEKTQCCICKKIKIKEQKKCC